MDEGYKEFEAYLAQQAEGSPVFSFVDEILFPNRSAEPESGKEDVVEFADPSTEPATLTVAAMIVGLTIFRLAKIAVKSVNNRLEFNEAKRRLEFCREIAKDQGMTLELAEKMMTRTLEVLARRGEKDSAFHEIMDVVKELQKK